MVNEELSATFRLTVLDPPARIFISAYDWLTIPGRGASFTYTWDGKDGNGNVAPKGIYKYVITASQTAVIETPNYHTFSHREMESDKSDWGIGLMPVEKVSQDPDADTATVRVKFVAGSAGQPPGQTWELSQADLRVYDPDALEVGSPTPFPPPLTLGEEHVHQVQLTLPVPKAGPYLFLVTAWDKLYLGHVHKHHETKPLEQMGETLEFKTKLTLEWDCMPDCDLGDHNIIESGLKEAWAKVGYGLEVDPDHDTNCEYYDFIGDRLDYYQLMGYFLRYVAGDCSTYLLGAHRWQEEHDVAGRCWENVYGMVFTHQGGVNQSAATRVTVELHEVACHDYTVFCVGGQDLGHCKREDSNCACHEHVGANPAHAFCDDEEHSSSSASQYCAPRLRWYREQ